MEDGPGQRKPTKSQAMKQKLRVLLDLSMGLHGYSGIPQDVRLLYKTLALSPEVEVTGLVYPERTRAPLHRFCGKDASLGERLSNQAVLLWNLANGEPDPIGFSVKNFAKKVRHMIAALGSSRVTFDRLAIDKFWPTLWRLVFSPTLLADDMHLVQNGEFLLADIYAGMTAKRGMRHFKPFRLDTRGFDFVIVQGSRPFRVSPGTRQIVRYHDMIPVLHPDTRPNTLDIKWHHRAICQSLDAYYVCNSEPTRDDLIEVYPQLRNQSSTIPYMLSDAYRPEPNPTTIRSIIAGRRSEATGAAPSEPLKKTPQYVMSVSTLEPRKNFAGLVQAFKLLKHRESVRRVAPKLKLLIVGSPGWKFEPILGAMRDMVASGDLIHLERVTAEELRVLYSHAEAFVFPSHAEGFGFPPLEAMQCDTPVIASNLAEHRWVLGDAAVYCDSYDPGSIADAIQRIVASDESLALRSDLIAKGRKRLERYSLERCSGQWVELMHRLKSGRAPVATMAPPTTSRVERSAMDRAA